MRDGGSFLSLTYLASERVIPGYGGGMSSAKAALESDTRTLAFEAGRKFGCRVNTISAGPLASRAASAIGIIEKMVEYVSANAPLTEKLTAAEVGKVAAFLCVTAGGRHHRQHGVRRQGLPRDGDGRCRRIVESLTDQSDLRPPGRRWSDDRTNPPDPITPQALASPESPRAPPRAASR